MKDKLDQLKTLKLKIEKSINDNKLTDAHKLIECFGVKCKNVDYYSSLALCYYAENNIKLAIDTLNEGAIVCPYEFDIFYNRSIFYIEINKLSSAIVDMLSALDMARNNSDKKIALDLLRKYRKRLYKQDKSSDELITKIDYKLNGNKSVNGIAYPLDETGNSLIRKIQYKTDNSQFLTNMYKSNYVNDINQNTRLFFKTELLRGQKINEYIEYNISQPSIVPISLLESSTEIVFIQESDTYHFKSSDLSYNRFHYLRFNNEGVIKVKTSKPFFLGTPIKIKDNSANKKLVLKIFIDGLSQKFIEDHGLVNVMPNTYEYFKDGFISESCYTTSEWTLPSKASINTGVYSTKHKLLHPEHYNNFEKHFKLLAEYFKEEDYYTADICANWRTTPRFGYYKGIDRFIYKNFLGDMDCGDIINEAIEHIESFKSTSKYLSLSIMDLHNVPDSIENTLYGQVHTDIVDRVKNQAESRTSVLTGYNESKISKYYEELKRIDIYLGLLYGYIEKTYNLDDVVILLHSDHGQSFLSDESGILHEHRRKIPLMVKSGNCPTERSREFIESIDILPILLSTANIEYPTFIDGSLPEVFGGEKKRDFVITQIIHPNQPYQIVIEDSKHIFTLRTDSNVDDSLRVVLDYYHIILKSKSTGNDEKELFPEKTKKYKAKVFDLVEEFISVP